MMSRDAVEEHVIFYQNRCIQLRPLARSHKNESFVSPFCHASAMLLATSCQGEARNGGYPFCGALKVFGSEPIRMLARRHSPFSSLFKG
jgi:hypothetical protein